MKRKPTPSQRLWAELFGPVGVPELDERKVQEILQVLPLRHRMAVRLRFGFEKHPLSFSRVGRKLPRAHGGGKGVCAETTRLLIRDALKRLKEPGCRRCWKEAKQETKGDGTARKR
jgi:DNA-directed RNA polymerase sigma subunit (sigma70/sigma32)